jgi:hypothetical protein
MSRSSAGSLIGAIGALLVVDLFAHRRAIVSLREAAG